MCKASALYPLYYQTLEAAILILNMTCIMYYSYDPWHLNKSDI